ncbi:MAG: hypothetical protein ACTJG2_00915 [Candidatus Saccharimonadales bacterium]
MPRRNKAPKHSPYRPSVSSRQKTRFASKKQAEDAAERQMLLKPELELFVYREIDGGWYLTRKQHDRRQ